MNEDEIVTLFFNPDINRFTDGDFGNIIDNIFQFITPGELMIFKKYKNKYLVPDRTNSFLVELIYPDKYEEEEINNETVRTWVYTI